MWKCDKCHEYRFATAKECHCKKFVVFDEDDEEWDFYAMDEEGAALKFAKKYNENGDYALMNEEMRVEVILESGGDKTKFIVGAEPDIHYSVSQQ